MVDGKRKEDWDHTASLKSQLANMFKDKNSPAFMPDEFHPLRAQKAREKKKKSISVNQLTAAFVGI
jgi:hypothetical protein